MVCGYHDCVPSLRVVLQECGEPPDSLRVEPVCRLVEKQKVGEKIGEAVGKDEVIPESAAVREELETVQQLPETPVTAELTGNAVMDLNINLSGERPTVSAKVQRNSTPFQYNTGRIQEAREAF